MADMYLLVPDSKSRFFDREQSFARGPRNSFSPATTYLFPQILQYFVIFCIYVVANLDQ